MATLLLACLLSAAPVPQSTDEGPAHQWGQWRGPLSNGLAPHADPPLEWDEDTHVRWKAALPGEGHSSPVVWGERVFVTTAIAVGEALEPAPETAPGAHDNQPVTHVREFAVLAFDRANGELLWQRVVRRELPHERAHVSAGFASASPVTDGELVWASFGSRGLYCLDVEGGLVWERDLGDMRAKHEHGEGSSPALYGDTLVVNWDHEGQSFVVALDKLTGEDRWRVERDELTSWATPIVVDVAGRPQAIVPGTNRLRAYDLATGSVIWECGGLSHNVVASPVAGGGRVIVGSSYEKQVMLAVRLEGAAGDLTSGEDDHLLWVRRRSTPYVPSPLLTDEGLYFLHHYQGRMSRLDPATGEEATGPFRLPGLGNVYASPVSAAGRIYVTDLEGTTLVLRAGPEPEVLATNRLDDSFSASAALAGDELFLRGMRHLYCIGPPRVREVDVRFAGSGGLELFGHLRLPAGTPDAGAPALVLLPGSGPTDRNGNQMGLRTDLLKQIAERLADEGVASLRFDKRATLRYASTFMKLGVEEQNDFFAFEHFVGDARAAFEFLRERPEVDPRRVGILGHSEGGLIALALARDPSRTAPAALVLAGTPARTLADVLRYQIERAFAAAEASERERILKGLDAAIEAVVNTGAPPAEVPRELAPLFPANAARLLQVELALDPTALARVYRGPVLVLHGGRDIQVLADETVAGLGAALAVRPFGTHRIHVAPEASHNLKPVSGEADPGFKGPVEPSVLDTLVAFVAEALDPAALAPPRPDDARVQAVIEALDQALASGSRRQGTQAILAARDVLSSEAAPWVFRVLGERGTAEIGVELMRWVEHPGVVDVLLGAYWPMQAMLEGDPELHALLLRSIAQHGVDHAVDVLVDEVSRSVDPRVLSARCMGLARIRTADSLDGLFRILERIEGLEERARADALVDFDLAVRWLTGAEPGPRAADWRAWRDRHPDAAPAAEPPTLPADLRARWDAYWAPPKE